LQALPCETTFTELSNKTSAYREKSSLDHYENSDSDTDNSDSDDIMKAEQVFEVYIDELRAHRAAYREEIRLPCADSRALSQAERQILVVTLAIVVVIIVAVVVCVYHIRH
jgi:hypothetical protein